MNEIKKYFSFRVVFDKYSKIIFFFLILFTLSYSVLLSQVDTVKVPSDISPNEGNLNTAINTSIKASKLSKTIFKLELNGYYVLSGTITIPAGEKLTIIAPEPGRAQDSAPPLVFHSSLDGNITKKLFDCYGDIILKNIWLLNGDTKQNKLFSNLQIHDSPDTIKGQVAIFDGVIFDYFRIPADGSGAVGISAKHLKGIFKNCYFRNNTDQLFKHYGKAVSCPFNSRDWHIDSLVFENCTFANMGYVYMQEGNGYADYLKFNY